MFNWNILAFVVYAIGMLIFVRYRVKKQQIKKKSFKTVGE